jgi:hypothetical protein
MCTQGFFTLSGEGDWIASGIIQLIDGTYVITGQAGGPNGE